MYFKKDGKEYLVSPLKDEDITAIFELVKTTIDGEPYYEYKFINYFSGGQIYSEKELKEFALLYIG